MNKRSNKNKIKYDFNITTKTNGCNFNSSDYGYFKTQNSQIMSPKMES